MPSTTGFNNYEYNNNKVLENDNFSFNFALDRVYNNYEYDANGNMTKTTKYSLPLMQPSFPAIVSSRNLYWNDSDQLQAMTDYSNSAHYFYNYAGDRTWKVVGAKITTTLSGIQRTYNVFNQSTYYLFPQVTITNSAYTKHIFAGTERICSKIGTGKSVDILQLFLPPTAQITAKRSQQTYLMKRTFTNLCIPSFGPPPVFLCAISSGANILNTNLLASSMTKITSTATEPENLQYFYLSDHLGSSSWITDKDGNALQHLSYLPFGEDFANQKAQNSNFDTEYKFLGKELDAETGYIATDFRYYDPGLGVFLSVDPLSDKYPSLSPYAYCANNPVVLVDPNGMEIHDPPYTYLPVVYAIPNIIEKYGYSSSVKQAGYFMGNTANANYIKNNLNVVATNFQINIGRAIGRRENIEGSPQNAIRHSLWNALMARDLGDDQATRAANSHETGWSWNLNSSKRSFTYKIGDQTSYNEAFINADNVADLLNNEIGRAIGLNNHDADNKTLASLIMKEYYTNGLYTTRVDNGSVVVEKTRISKEQYVAAMKEISKKGNNGLNK